MKAMNLQIKERLIALRNYLLSSAPAQVLGEDDAIVVEKEGNGMVAIVFLFLTRLLVGVFGGFLLFGHFCQLENGTIQTAIFERWLHICCKYG